MFLGLDLGTSSLKAVLVDEEGEIHAQISAPLRVSRPYEGWSEQEPSDWVRALDHVLSELGAQLRAVQAIGLSGQMHGAVCLDARGQVLRPAILWNDTRAEAEARWLDEDAALKVIFGNITFPGFTAPKILWLKAHEPEIYENIDKILLPKDYLRYYLSGAFVSDYSDASGTAWLDIGARDWSDVLLAKSGLERAQMPMLCEGSEISAYLAENIIEKYGFAGAIPIAGGAGDNAATAIGLEIFNPGAGFLSLGTSGVVFAVNAQFSPNPESALHAFAHAVPERYHQMGVTLSASDCLSWFSRQLDLEPSKLMEELEEVYQPSAEIFLPFLGGERTPYNLANLRASFHKIGHNTTRESLLRSVLEGVSFSLRQSVELIEAQGETIAKLKIVGGGAQSDYWLQLLANILCRPVLRPSQADNAAALGAARLGAMAIKKNFPQRGEVQEFLPNALVDFYENKYQIYCEIAKEEAKNARNH